MFSRGRGPPRPPGRVVPDPWIDVEAARRQRGGIVWSWCVDRLRALRGRPQATGPAPAPEQVRTNPLQES